MWYMWRVGIDGTDWNGGGGLIKVVVLSETENVDEIIGLSIEVVEVSAAVSLDILTPLSPSLIVKSVSSKGSVVTGRSP